MVVIRKTTKLSEALASAIKNIKKNIKSGGSVCGIEETDKGYRCSVCKMRIMSNSLARKESTKKSKTPSKR